MTTANELARADSSEAERQRIALRNERATINTNLPGTVVNASDGRVSVRLDILREFNGEPAPALVLPDVPVAYPGGQAMRLKWPVRAGDTGLVLFAQRDMDRWLSGQVEALPATRRLLDYNDGVFVPGLEPFGEDFPDATTLETDKATVVIQDDGTVTVANTAGCTLEMDATGNITLGNNAGSVTVTAAGSVAFTGAGGSLGISPGGGVTVGGGPGGGGDDLVGLLVETLSALAATTVLPHSPGGTAAISTQAQFAALLVRLRTLQG